jgi:hypothetical protein
LVIDTSLKCGMLQVLNRFVLKEIQINSENQTPKDNNIDEIEGHDDYTNIAGQGEALVAEIGKGDDSIINKGVSYHTDDNDTSF